MKTSSWLVASALCVLVACGGSDAPVNRAGLFGSLANAQSSDAAAEIRPTPVTMRIDHSPVPVAGSDGRLHLVYEIELTNFGGNSASIQDMSVLDARNGNVVATLTAAQLAQRLVVRDRAAVKGTLGPAQFGILYMHVLFDNAASIPGALAHRLSVLTGSTTTVETAARIQAMPPTNLVLESPLRGARYIAGDGCCDSVRHVQATLPLNGQLFLAQRFAIDWEQLDEQDRIYAGDPTNPASYIIYGKPVYAVAEARVVTVVDGLPDTPPGALPASIPIEQADGNHVVLELGEGRYALYAHLKPGSVNVRKGDLVRAGQVLGQVGTSGNSSEPHLHFQVTDTPSTLASNGLPYLLRSFSAARRGVSTAAFDKAIIDGKPLATEPVASAGARERVMPLDLWIVDFP